mgnify:CR=1 FL=1
MESLLCNHCCDLTSNTAVFGGLVDHNQAVRLVDGVENRLLIQGEYRPRVYHFTIYPLGS